MTFAQQQWIKSSQHLRSSRPVVIQRKHITILGASSSVLIYAAIYADQRLEIDECTEMVLSHGSYKSINIPAPGRHGLLLGYVNTAFSVEEASGICQAFINAKTRCAIQTHFDPNSHPFLL